MSTPQERRITPSEAAAYLMAIIESRGGRFTLRRDGYFYCDLDAVDFTSWDGVDAESVGHLVVMLGDEIGALLHEQARTAH